jgi:hypothetical protein
MDTTISSDVIRKGATRVQLYNEGLLVYLYDEKNRQPTLESGFLKFNFKHGLPVEPGTNVILEKV